jgi:hypothetical protein
MFSPYLSCFYPSQQTTFKLIIFGESPRVTVLFFLRVRVTPSRGGGGLEETGEEVGEEEEVEEEGGVVRELLSTHTVCLRSEKKFQ